MASKNLKLAVAELMLTKPGIDVSLIQVDSQIKAEEQQAAPDRDRLESLYSLRKQLRKLKEED